MKIQNGFISNSLSSSFIIDTKKTTIQTAQRIINYIIPELSQYWTKKQLNDVYNIQKSLENLVHFDIPTKVPWSINYETYIWRDKKSKKIYIDTCNNHCWEDLFGVEIEYIKNYEKFEENHPKLFFDVENKDETIYGAIYEEMLRKR